MQTVVYHPVARVAGALTDPICEYGNITRTLDVKLYTAMRTIRRYDLSPRIELLPLIDVIFLLLVFFIYSFLVMTYARVLPVELTPVTGGESAPAGRVAAITLDAAGVLYLDQKPMTFDQLRAELTMMAQADQPPQLFIAAATPQGDGAVDRLPVYLELQQMVLEIWPKKLLNFVGPPGKSSTAQP